MCFQELEVFLEIVDVPAELIDELIVYMAPTLLGSLARPLLELPLHAMSEKVQLHIQDVRKVGDVCVLDISGDGRTIIPLRIAVPPTSVSHVARRANVK